VNVYTSVHYYLLQYEKHCLLKYADFQIEADNILTKTFHFKNQIKQIQLNNEFFVVLESNGDIHKYDFKDEMLRKLNFLSVETQSEIKSTEHITFVATGETINVATTSANSIFNIPNKIFELKKHEKIKKVCCGMEHALLLTSNGDVFSWGIGL
jgi:alpha-tubulin suppressor-like RCC1 family protein